MTQVRDTFDKVGKSRQDVVPKHLCLQLVGVVLERSLRFRDGLPI